VKLNIEDISGDSLQNSNIELVERKGLGHPDSICDGLAESVSRALSKEYKERFGKVLHHNTDEVQLVAGSSEPRVEGGELIEPIYVLLTGRATKEFQEEKIPVDQIALDAAKNYIDSNFDKLSSEHFEFESRIGETSTDLKTVFSQEVPKSNDTSFGVGHAPLSPTEKCVKKVEETLREEISEVGEDIKVMGLRKEERLQVTVAAATISSRIASLEHYFETKEKIKEKTESIIEDNSSLEPEVHVNTADKNDEESIYLTVTGTSAEMGDDGSVGRGNRVNGLITPHRSMSLEAASGKNPVTHIGKIYNLLAQEIAETVYEETGSFAQVKLLSQIGKPLDEPQSVEVETGAEREVVEEIVDRKLESIEEVTEKCLRGEISTF